MALAFMRRHKKWLHFFLWMCIPAMIIAFVALYIPTEDARAGNPGGVLAEVGGQPITLGEYQTVYRQAGTLMASGITHGTSSMPRHLRWPLAGMLWTK